MSAPRQGESLYDVLGVARDADEASIRRAYFRLVRQHTPEDDPERFRAVSEAYRVLSNPEERSAYDHSAGLPDEFRIGIAEAYEVLATDAEGAAAAADRLLDAFGDRHDVLLTIAVLYVRAQKPGRAVPLLQALHKAEGAKPGILAWLGVAYREMERYDAAESAFRAALRRAPEDPELHVALADTYVEQGRLDDALNALEQAIRADGRVDIADLQLFLRKLWLLGARRDWDALNRTVRTIESLVPAGDDDARRYVAAQLHELAARFSRAEADDLAHFALLASLRLVDDPALRAVAEELSRRSVPQDESERFAKDATVAPWIRELVEYAFRESHSPTGVHRFAVAMRRRLANRALSGCHEWARFKQKYPNIAAAADEIYRSVRGPRKLDGAPRSLSASELRLVEAGMFASAIGLMTVLAIVAGAVFLP